jgi:hypothetical protein
MMHPEWRLRKRHLAFNGGRKRISSVLPTVFQGSQGTVSDLRRVLFADELKPYRDLVILREILHLNNQEIRRLTGVSDNKIHDKVTNAVSWLGLNMRALSEKDPRARPPEGGEDMSSGSVPPSQYHVSDVAKETREEMVLEEKSALELLAGAGKRFATEGEAKAAMANGLNWAREKLVISGPLAGNSLQLLDEAKSLTLFSALSTNDNFPRTYDLAARSPTSPEHTQFQRLMKFIQDDYGNRWKKVLPSELYKQMRGLGPFIRITAGDGSEHWLRVSDLFSTLFRDNHWGSLQQAKADQSLLQQADNRSAQDVYNMRIQSLGRVV